MSSRARRVEALNAASAPSHGAGGVDRVQCRIVAVALAAAVALLVALSPAAGRAADFDLVTWDMLAPPVAAYDDPFEDMSYEHKSDLRDVLRAREARESGKVPPALQAAEAGALLRLQAAGLDADDLLRQRLVVMDRRRQEATGVASAVVDRAVLLDGYALPLKWQGERAVEFLLVPWVGACIHTPPPPPNQVVHVSYPDGLRLDQWFEPVRLSGTLRYEPAAHSLFLVDGSHKIPASYALVQADLAGVPGTISAASVSELPLFSQIQLRTNQLFTSGMSALQEGDSVRAMLIAVLLSFAYGVLHTLGPGHGKTVVISYFVGTGGSLRRGIGMGVRIAVFHVLSAVVVVSLIDVAWRQATGSAPSDTRAIRLGSYALIMAIGIAMSWQAIAAWRAAGSSGQHHHPAHDHVGCAACAPPKGGNWVAVAIGAVPCTGALLVMLFGLANDLVGPAIVMVLAISAGMAVAMSAIGVSALWARDWAAHRLATAGKRPDRFERQARLAGAACVLAIGAGLFIATLMHTPGKDTPPKRTVGSGPESYSASG